MFTYLAIPIVTFAPSHSAVRFEKHSKYVCEGQEPWSSAVDEGDISWALMSD